ncbi:MAG: hypothetical protein LBB56_06375 [Chitinispirillales bacterium]|nr:hypothetical protein [Chitinispirillales bacterium]
MTKTFDKLIETFKDYDVEIIFENELHVFQIKNPYWNENIEVYYNKYDEDEEEYIFFFSFQHTHFSKYNADDSIEEIIDDLIEYIKDFLSGKLVAIEFFKKGKNTFGGGVIYADLDISSKKNLIYSFWGSDIPSKKNLIYNFYENWLFNLWYKKIDSCSIRNWNGAYNKDIKFDT